MNCNFNNLYPFDTGFEIGRYKMIENVKIIRSKRKTISVCIKTDCSIEVRAPMKMPKAEINEFLIKKSGWLEKHMQKMKERQKQQEQAIPLTKEEIQELANKAMLIIPERAAYYARLMGVNYGRITIRNQKTRWGSCSSKGNLNFNCLLMLTPTEVMDYVVVHELCHLKELNHSKRFWEEVSKVMPDYQQHNLWLKEHGNEIIMRMNY